MPPNALRDRLGYAFNRPELLLQALTHRSHGAAHNERLEFVGDSVLNCVIAVALYRRFAQMPEGELSRLRASLVNRETLARLAAALDIGDAMKLGEGEQRSGGAARPSMLADALEAVFGAVFVDGGFEAARTVIEIVYATELAQVDPAVARQGSEDAAAGVAAGSADAGARVRGRRHHRRSACADVHRRMHDTVARHRGDRHGPVPPGGRAGRGPQRVRRRDGNGGR